MPKLEEFDVILTCIAMAKTSAYLSSAVIAKASTAIAKAYTAIARKILLLSLKLWD